MNEFEQVLDQIGVRILDSQKKPSPNKTDAEAGSETVGKATASGGAPRDPSASAPLNTQLLFSAANIDLQRHMRFNPLRMLTPQRLSLALDNFENGILREAAMLWDAMAKRDDTLITVKNHLEESVASKDWGVFKKPKLTPNRMEEAARHQACLRYFYNSVVASDAFDRNERGGKERLIKHMMRAESYRYALGHLVWKPKPGKLIEVEGARPAPVISAEIEHVPLWYFENTSGTMRFLPFGGFGVAGQEMNWDGEWMVTTGRGMMFAASICYTFKRLTFQDWTIYNERYGQNKVVGQTSASEESPQGQAFAEVVREFNSDQGIVLYESQVGDKLPIQLMGPSGEATVDIFSRFVDRQDRKMTVMYRGSDLSTMSRSGAVGASLQGDEVERMETSCCRMIQSTCNYFLDRQIIRYCFGEGVEPLAYFGLPDIDREQVADIRDSAGFLADRGTRVRAAAIADRLGIELAANGERALKPAATASASSAVNQMTSANASDERQASGLLSSIKKQLRIADSRNASSRRRDKKQKR